LRGVQGFIAVIYLTGTVTFMDLKDWRIQYEAIFSNLPVGLSYLTPDMRYIRINPYLEKMLGVSSSEVEGRHCYDVVGMYRDDPVREGPERICDVCGVKTALETGEPYKFTRKNSADLTVENIGVPIKDKDSNIIGAIEIILDITEQVMLQERLKSYADDLERAVDDKTLELRKSKGFLSNMIQGIADAVFTLDRDCRITYANNSAERILGIPKGALTLRSIFDLAAEGYRGALEDAVKTTSATGLSTHNLNIKLKAYDGTIRHGLISVTLLPDDGSGAKFVCICKDVTRERELEKKRIEFMQMLSHDLKTPLTAIMGYAAIMLDGELGAISGPVRDSAQGIFNNAKRMNTLLEDFISAEKMDDVALEVKLAEIDMGVLLEDVVGGMEPLFSDKGIVLSSDIPESLPRINGDRDKLERLFVNLLGNAAKYSYYGGRVGVEALHENGQVVVKVWDTGPGIPEEDLPNLFEKYYRAGERSQGSSGTGLGLFISKAIVDAHDGIISAMARDGGKGSVFEVRLPHL